MNITFDEVRKNIEYVLSSRENYFDIIDRDKINEIHQLYDILLNQINLLQDSKEVEKNELNKVEQIVCNVYPYIINVCVMKPLSEDIRLFLLSLNQLLFNWNINSVNSRNISDYCTTITNLVNDYVSLIEMIKMLKYLVEQVNKISTWLPPSLDVSKHYSNLIENQLRSIRDGK